MAKATIIKGKTETIIKQIEEDKIILELTPLEAKALKIVTGSIGGHPETTPRKYTESIYNALNYAGIISQGTISHIVFNTHDMNLNPIPYDQRS